MSELARFVPALVISDKEDTINTMKTYSPCLPAPVDEFILRGEVDLWRQNWVRAQALNPEEAVPGTALEGLVACDRQTFPFINSFLTILLTLPVSTAGVERSFSTLRRVKTWLRSRMGEKRMTGLALLNIHRDIPVSAESVIDRFSKTRRATLIS